VIMIRPYFEIGDVATSSLTEQIYEVTNNHYANDNENKCCRIKVRLNRDYYRRAIQAGKHVPLTESIMSECDFEEYRLGQYTNETYQKSKQNDSFQKHGLNDSRVLLINKYKNK
jgi:hypothetical protein